MIEFAWKYCFMCCELVNLILCVLWILIFRINFMFIVWNSFDRVRVLYLECYRLITTCNYQELCLLRWRSTTCCNYGLQLDIAILLSARWGIILHEFLLLFYFYNLKVQFQHILLQDMEWGQARAWSMERDVNLASQSSVGFFSSRVKLISRW